MPEAIALLISQGPLGLVAGLFVYLYLNERKQRHEDQKAAEKELHEQRDRYYSELDKVRRSQIDREREVAKTLEEYGRGIVQALDQSEFLAKELRRMYERPGR